MSLLAWNCRGPGNPRAVRFLKEITQKLKPSIIFLSETLSKLKKIEEVCKALHFAGWWGIEAQGHSGGLALLWKNEGGCTILDGSKHYIDFEVENNQVGRWRYTGFYGCPERERRRDSWDIIRNLAGRSALPWCIIGDFNDMLFADEKKGGRVHPRSLLVGFGDTIVSCGLTDLGYKGEKFTCEKSRGNNGWVQERLDRGLANNSWRNMFPMAEVQVLELATSDHLPFFLNLKKQVFEVKERRFRFENSWVKEKDCRKIVKQSWQGNDSQDLMTKIIMCCNRLQEWGGGASRKYKQELSKCRERLRRLRSRRDGVGIRMYNDVRWEYMKLLEKQETYWKQRAKQLWLQGGDRNTRYFHNYASGRKRMNTLQRIKNDEGEWKETTEEIQGVIEDYFSKLFTAHTMDGKLSDREIVSKVTASDNEALLAEITPKEVKKDAFSMHQDKAPGPDGLNPGFFQVYWNIIGRDVVLFCKIFLQVGELPNEVNHAVVRLIPKTKVPQNMTELRPISLCNVLVRILSKVLVNILKPCLCSVISEVQSAFLEGRLLRIMQ